MDEILREVSQGKSPVSGEGSFKKLNPDYAEENKGGDRTPSLDLEGDMLNALDFKNTTDGVEIGIFNRSEVPKADGHNNFSGQSQLPRRRFIPGEKQKFKQFIDRGIKRIVRDAEREPTPRDEQGVRRGVPTPTPVRSDSEQQSVRLDDLFSDSFLEDLLFGESTNRS